MANVVINTNMPDDLPTYENAMKSKVVCKKYWKLYSNL